MRVMCMHKDLKMQVYTGKIVNLYAFLDLLIVVRQPDNISLNF
jgi:hypothetical protein